MSIADELRRDAEAALKEDGMYYSGKHLSGIAKKVETLADEHARLRSLLQGAVNEQLEDCGDCWGGLCEDCGCWVAEREKELKELGIEVE